MDLEKIIGTIQDQRLKDSDAAFKNIASSEKYLQQAYEGRYIFELIQNVRDANKQAGMRGTVLIELKESVLIISNTGSPFSERGINSVTTIGDSPKQSQEFIGFKGIGFKSVHEISDTPSIMTNWGTISFDKSRTKSLLQKLGRQLDNKDIPLFFIPHYDTNFITKEETQIGLVTKITLPLKERIDIKVIEKGFNEIGIHQILLLGCLDTIQFRNEDKISKFSIKEDELNGKVSIQKDSCVYKFKKFKPTRKLQVPDKILNSLEDKEKEIYEKEPFVDISLVFDLDVNNRLSKNKDCKLYLFYPTEIISGFNFIIHSYFLVTPDRKGLRNSQLNNFILECIADYLAGEWLAAAKRSHKTTFLEFLVFARNPSAPILNVLYDKLVENLKNEKLFFDKEKNKFLKIHEVIIADGFDKGLFPENQLNGKRLIYINDEITRDWLLAEFKVEYLTNKTIAENIEKECVRQKSKKNFPFFENLYRYLVTYDNLDLSTRKVLLSGRMQLLSSEDYVFYGLKEKIPFPASIQDKINFIHPSIKISDQRQGSHQAGFVEYKTELLVNQLLKLFDDENVNKIDILTTLLRLNISGRLTIDIRRKILLPVKDQKKWVNPFTNAIYIESEELKAIYPGGKFIDLALFSSLPLHNSELTDKLIQFGVWKVPALYYSAKSSYAYSSDIRFKYINTNIRAYTTPFFEIHGDWILDEPVNVTEWFTSTVMAQWSRYLATIENEDNPVIRYKSQVSDLHTIPGMQVKNITSFIKYLRTGHWIKSENIEGVFSVEEVIGIDPIETIQAQSFLFKKYLVTLPVHFVPNFQLIQLIGLKHLDSHSIDDFRRIFLNIYNNYKTKETADKEFISFYNKVISKLFDLYSLSNFNKNDIVSLSNSFFLGLNEMTQMLEWKPAKSIYYIEDKPAYNLLPAEIKILIQPHFTNQDKNRFGQIAKRLGLDFKKTIEQRLLSFEIIKELKAWDWFPGFGESLALVEVLLETNLDTRLTQIQKSQLIICDNLEIELYKDSEYVSILENVTHKIEVGENIIVYINGRFDTQTAKLYSNVLHDLLVEVLGRDLHRVRLSLNEFYSRNNRIELLESFEVTPERVDEINSKLKGILLTKLQTFWFAIMKVRDIPNPASYVKDESIDFEKLMPLFNSTNSHWIDLVDLINYDRIYETGNITPLGMLFETLAINLDDFNKNSEVKIDFREHFQRQFEGLKVKYKSVFESKLYNYLKDKTIQEKSAFQDEVDEYSGMLLTLYRAVVYVDCEACFFNDLIVKYPELKLSKDELKISGKASILSTYQKNLSSFKKAVIENDLDKPILDDFISLNKNRSLLYFDETGELLRKLFNDFKLPYKKDVPANQSPGVLDLGLYINPANLVVEEITTGSIEGSNGTPNNHGSAGKGQRVDGGKVNFTLELLGAVAEKMVFDKLYESNDTTEWISKNASKAGINPEGSDIHGYDIKYLDCNNEVQYVEVKGKVDDQKHFYISYPEYKKALSEKENYHIYLVLFTLDNNKRKIFHLGNIFLLNEKDDVFNNERFTANFNSLEIRFK